MKPIFFFSAEKWIAVNEITSRPSPSDCWRVVYHHVSLAVEQNPTLAIKNFRPMASLTEISGMPKSTKEDSGSSALLFNGILLCPGSQASDRH